MTNEQNSRIATRLCGYEVQASPAGKYYIVTDEGTRPMPDFEVDWHEAMTTLIAVCKSRNWDFNIIFDPLNTGCPSYASITEVESFSGSHDVLKTIAHCLLQIAEGEE